jgi:hypothetical protein
LLCASRSLELDGIPENPNRLGDREAFYGRWIGALAKLSPDKECQFCPICECFCVSIGKLPERSIANVPPEKLLDPIVDGDGVKVDRIARRVPVSGDIHPASTKADWTEANTLPMFASVSAGKSERSFVFCNEAIMRYPGSAELMRWLIDQPDV